DVGKECCVAGVINGWTVANGEDESAGVPCVNWWRHLVLHHARSVPCRHKTNRRITIEQIELSTESAGRVVVGLFRRIAESKFHRLGEIVSGNELRARALSDFDRVSDVIAVAVRQQN